MSKKITKKQKLLLNVLEGELGFNYLWRKHEYGPLIASTHVPPLVSPAAVPPVVFPDGYRSCVLNQVFLPEFMFELGSLVDSTGPVDIGELLDLEEDRSQPDVVVFPASKGKHATVFEIMEKNWKQMRKENQE